MKRRFPWLAAGAALCASLACENEVTVHLLRDLAVRGNAGQAGLSEAGASDEAGAGGEANGNGGEAGSGAVNPNGGEAGTPPDQLPCQKLGTEVCNGGDDDCNGIIDDECDYTVVWSTGTESVPMGHLNNATQFQQPCVEGSVLIGLRVGMGNWLNQVQAVCRQIELHADSTRTPVQFTLTLGAKFNGISIAPTMTGDMKNKVQDLVCPDGLVLSGVDGTVAQDSARYIFGMRITCARPIVNALGSVPIIETDHTLEQMSATILCDGCSASQTFNYTTTIPTGQIATGLFGADGLWIDRVGFGASHASIKSQ